MLQVNERVRKGRPSMSRRKGSTMEEIKVIALKMFNQWGYRGTTVRDICEEMEITAPSMYYYFDSKQKIFDTLMEEAGLLLRDTLESAMAICQAASAKDRLRHLFDAYRIFYRHHYEEAVFLVKVRCFSEKGLSQIVNPEQESQYKWMNEKLTDFLAANPKRRMPKTDLPAILLAFDSFVTGYLLQLHQGLINDSEEQAQQSWELFWNGIK